MTNQYTWTDNPMVSGVSLCDTDVVNENLMHLKYDNTPVGVQFVINSGYIDSNGKADILSYSGGGIIDKITPIYSSQNEAEIGLDDVVMLTPSYWIKTTSSGSAMPNNTYISFDLGVNSTGSTKITYSTYQIPDSMPNGGITLVQGSNNNVDWNSITFTQPVRGTIYLSNNSYRYIRILGVGDEVAYGRFGLYNLRIHYSKNTSVATELLFKVDDGTTYKPLVVTFKDSVKTFESIPSIGVSNLSAGTYSIWLKPDGSVEALKTLYIDRIEPTSPVANDVFRDCSYEPLTQYKYSDSTNKAEYDATQIGSITVTNGVITAVQNSQFNQNGYDVNFQTQGYKMPDYKNKVAKAVNTTYTAECDGYLVCRVDGSTIASAIVVNETLVATSVNATCYQCVCNALVGKNDTYRFGQSGGSFVYGYFVPLKGAK